MLSEMYMIVLNSTITGLIISLCVYVAIKIALPNIVNEQKFILKDDLEVWLNSEKGAKALYAIGGLVAAGMQTGLGIKTRGGKFKWEDLLLQFGANWLQNQFGAKQTQNVPNIPNAPQIPVGKHWNQR